MSSAVAHDSAGRAALVESDDGAGVSLRLSDGTRVVLPQSAVERRSDGSYLAAVSFDGLAGGRHVFHEVEERLAVRTVERERARVAVS